MMNMTSPSMRFHTIKKGDTLWQIAQQNQTTVDAILALNPGLQPERMPIGTVIALFPGLGTLEPRSQNREPVQAMNRSSRELSENIRLLWQQHITWTILAIVSLVYDNPDASFVVQRLLRNPSDFAQVFSIIYGPQVAARFEQLFTEHLVIAADLVKAAKAGNQQLAAEKEKAWYANADEIAEFLSRINPHWSKQKWQQMMYEHLAMTKDEAVDRLTGNYQAAVRGYDEIERQALMMADMMVDGMIQQFPDQFR